MTKKRQKWITIREYADKVGRSVPQVYLDIRFGKIPKENWKNDEYDYHMKRNRMMIKIDE